MVKRSSIGVCLRVYTIDCLATTKRCLKKHYHTHIIKEIIDKSVKFIDSSIISLCLTMFDRAMFQTAKGGIKLHRVWDNMQMTPEIVNISEAKVYEQLVFTKGTIIVEDRGYLNFTLILNRIKAENEFVTRIKCNTTYKTTQELALTDNID